MTSHLHCNYIRSKKWTGSMDKWVDKRTDEQTFVPMKKIAFPPHFNFDQRHVQPVAEHQSWVPRQLHRLLRRSLCILSQAHSHIYQYCTKHINIIRFYRDTLVTIIHPYSIEHINIICMYRDTLIILYSIEHIYIVHVQGHSQRWGHCALHLLCYADDWWIWLDNQVLILFKPYNHL